MGTNVGDETMNSQNSNAVVLKESRSLYKSHIGNTPILKFDPAGISSAVETKEPQGLQSEANIPAYALQGGRYGYRFVKRLFDIVFSACVIAVLFIPSLILCLAIRIESPGKPIYVQKRMCRHGKDGSLQSFNMYKFRSMCDDADSMLPDLKDANEADGPLFKINNDPRVTNIGHFIRIHSIDELPQFLNVFLGQMSCVGPRPPLPHEVVEYSERDLMRLSVKPGLTGYWQVNGRSDLSFRDMVSLDLK